MIRTFCSVMSICTTLSCLASPLAARQSSPNARVPVLELVSRTRTVDLAPLNLRSPLEVSSRGSALYLANPTSSLKLVLVDSSASLISRLGVPGEGPGEVRRPVPVPANSPDGFVTWDVQLRRVSHWDSKGKLRSQIRLGGNGQVFAEVAGGFIGNQRLGGPLFQPIFFPTGDSVAKPLLSESRIEHFRSIEDQRKGTKANVYGHVFGLWDDGFLVADPNDYVLSLFDWRGALRATIRRDVPAPRPSMARVMAFIDQSGGKSLPEVEKRKRVELMSAMELPHVSPGGVSRMDSAGRLWMLGIAGDSAFADVFTKDRFMGRLAIGCKGFEGFFSLRGQWLGMVCLPDDPDFDGDAIVKLFRIKG